MRARVQFLASDVLEGRGVETPGIQKAADYLAAEFEEMGLNTRIFSDQPFQRFAVSTGAELGPRKKTGWFGWDRRSSQATTRNLSS